MVPKAANYGHSFKGAFAYYLHDKGDDTAARVAWTEVRNIALDDPAFAQSVMIATARSAEQLKREAGVKMTGRKSTAGVVLAYSLAWSPDEPKPDRAEMIRAADMSIKHLKAENLQAVIICHTDTDHPHVHIVLNRVDPTNGKISTKNEHVELSKFREAYEKSRGQKLTKSWREKAREREQASKEKVAAAPEKRQPATPAAGPKNQGAILAERQAVMRARHKEEWQRLADDNKRKRDAIYNDKSAWQRMAADHRAENKPLWSALGKKQAQERREFLRNERLLIGTIANAIKIVTQQQQSVRRQDRRILSMCFAYVVSKEARAEALQTRQADQTATLKKSLDDAFREKFKQAQGGRYTAARKDYDAARTMLIERQEREKGELRGAWKQFYAERGDRGQSRRPYSPRAPSQSRQEAPQGWKRAWQQTPAQEQTNRPEPGWKRSWKAQAAAPAQESAKAEPGWKQAWKEAAAPDQPKSEPGWKTAWKEAASSSPAPAAAPPKPAGPKGPQR